MNHHAGLSASSNLPTCHPQCLALRVHLPAPLGLPSPLCPIATRSYCHLGVPRTRMARAPDTGGAHPRSSTCGACRSSLCTDARSAQSPPDCGLPQVAMAGHTCIGSALQHGHDDAGVQGPHVHACVHYCMLHVRVTAHAPAACPCPPHLRVALLTPPDSGARCKPVVLTTFCTLLLSASDW